MKKDKLNILFLVPSFPTVSETFIVNQITDLIDKGHDVTIFASDINKGVIIHKKIIEYNLLKKTIFMKMPFTITKRIGVFLNVFSKASFRNKLRILKTLNFIKHGLSSIKLTEFFKTIWILNTEDNFDIVHAHFGFMSNYYYNLKEYGFFQRASLVVTFHGYDIETSDMENNRKRYSKIINHHPLITTNTPYLKSIVRRTLGASANIKILPVGLDTRYFKQHNKKNTLTSELNIIYCGRLIRFKGFHLLPEIALKIKKKSPNLNFKFYIIGEGDDAYKNKVLGKINTYKVEKYFELLGSKTQDEIISLMSKCDIFILPGIYDNGRAETQGLVIQEAQALELPVIVSNVGGMPCGLIDNETGYVVKENDIVGFVNAILKFVENQNFIKTMGEKGRKFVVNNYDSSILGDKLIEYYSLEIKKTK